MESSKRGVWIFIAIVAAVAVVCCCAVVAVVAFLAPWRATQGPQGLRLPQINLSLPGSQSERIDQTFSVGSAPRLTVSDAAGKVTISAGDAGTIHVVATKHATSTAALSRIQVSLGGQTCCVDVKVSYPSASFLSNGYVDLEITAPADTILDLTTGAGSVDVQGIQGELKAETGAGSLAVQGATGPVSLTSGAGSIDYEGTPQGQCTFKTGTGTITLRLPAGTNASVDLTTGLGTVSSQFQVSGQVTRSQVHGTIGTGGQVTITASTGLGTVVLLQQ